MNDLCADIGWKSINHIGEQLCGDHVEIVEKNEDSTVSFLQTVLEAELRQAFCLLSHQR